MKHALLLTLLAIGSTGADPATDPISIFRSKVCSPQSKDRFDCPALSDSRTLIFLDKSTGTAFLFGHFSPELHKSLRELVTKRPIRAVLFTSQGGDIHSALQIAEMLNKGKIQHIAGRTCASACAISWAATTNRSVLPNTQLGFHQGRWTNLIPRLTKELLNKSPQDHTEILQKAGFPSDLISKINKTKNNDMLWLTADDLRKNGIKFSIAKPSLAA